MKNQVIVWRYVLEFFILNSNHSWMTFPSTKFLAKLWLTQQRRRTKRELCLIARFRKSWMMKANQGNLLTDKIISAEIPNPTTNLTLYRVVTSSMCHRLCGPVNLASPYMVANEEVQKGTIQCIQKVCTQNTDGGHQRMVVKLTA